MSSREDGSRRVDAVRAELGRDHPIDPTLVVEGAPRFRAKLLHTTEDERYPCALWDCTAGKFRWYFEGDELVYILEGRVIVHDDDGSVTRLGPGDTALFTAGTTNVWEVPCYVKKLAVERLQRPSIGRRVRALARDARRIVESALTRRAMRPRA